MRKKMLSFLLAAVIVLSMLPKAAAIGTMTEEGITERVMKAYAEQVAPARRGIAHRSDGNTAAYCNTKYLIRAVKTEGEAHNNEYIYSHFAYPEGTILFYGWIYDPNGNVLTHYTFSQKDDCSSFVFMHNDVIAADENVRFSVEVTDGHGTESVEAVTTAGSFTASDSLCSGSDVSDEFEALFYKQIDQAMEVWNQGLMDFVGLNLGDLGFTDYTTPTHKSVDTHDYQTFVSKEPACAELGELTTACVDCGDFSTESLPQLGHAWDLGVTIEAPSPDVNGIKRFTCERCGQYDDRFVPYLGTYAPCNGDSSRCPSAAFTDVSADAWYHDAVDWAADMGITNGTSDTTFSPDKGTTRGQIVTFLWRANGCPMPLGRRNPFTDVKEGAYYYHAVLWALEQGITNGTSANKFSPNIDCTKAHCLTFLWRSLGSPCSLGSVDYSDVQEGSWYYESTKWAVSHGVAESSGSKFGPAEVLTRSGFVVCLYRTMAH